MRSVKITIHYTTQAHTTQYRWDTVNSTKVNSKLSQFEIFKNLVCHIMTISCLRFYCYFEFHLNRSKNLLTNDFELTVPDL